LVSCTTIDWFSVWPADALKSVASKFLADLRAADDDAQHEEQHQQEGSPAASALRCAVEDTCILFHQSVRKLAEDYRR
jgi:dynein heavy chain